MRRDHDVLLRAICESPRDDLPRLAFADWLEEHGETERAGFIRTDVEMARRDEWDADRVRWEEGLTPQVLPYKPWFAAAYPSAGSDSSYSWGGPTLTRRGFRWNAKVWKRDPPIFRIVAAELFARHPIEHLTFFDHHPDPEWLLGEPWFPRLTGLGWTAGRCSAKVLRPLLKTAPAGLTELELTSAAINPDGMRALGASALFRNLTRLELSGTGARVIGATLDALARDGGSCRLRSFRIKFDGLNQEAAALASCLPASLRVLDISGTMLHTAGTRALVEALATPELRLLDLAFNGTRDEGATAVFTSPQLAGLKLLDLAYCRVGDAALQVLLEKSPLADGLNLLDLTQSSASPGMKQAVKERMGDRVRL
jgi:uncharacterized protein (TIGR02996 family)